MRRGGSGPSRTGLPRARAVLEAELTRCRRAAAALAALLVLPAPGCAGPDLSVPPGRDAVRTAAPDGPEAARAVIASVVPADLAPQERALFLRRDEGGAVWSASPMNGFDLTGVSWDGGRAVLITDRHVLFSAHTPSPKAGGRITFYDAGGWPVARTVEAARRLPRLNGADLDAVVGRLDAPVPGGVAVYPLAAADPKVMRALAAARAPVVVTFARGGRDEFGEPGWTASASLATLADVRSGGARVVYSRGSDLLQEGSRAGHDPIWGDSGHPSFLMRGRDLLLLSHYHTSQRAGAGPNYADPAVQRLIREAVETLDAE